VSPRLWASTNGQHTTRGGVLCGPRSSTDCLPVLQFDFTSCQGVLFVLLMTLFFSGLILAILLPFQYVSSQPSGPWSGGKAHCLGCCSLLHPPEQAQGQSSSLPSCPAPPGTCFGCVGSVSKQTRRLFLAGLGTCLAL
jgi:hypothetical protein